MKYYQLSHASRGKEIGNVFIQSTEVKHLVHMDNPLHLRKNGYGLLTNDVSIPEPILEKKAKVTDLISCIPISYRLIVSPKLKSVIEQYRREGIQFFPTQVHASDTALPYYLLNMIEYEVEGEFFAIRDGGVKYYVSEKIKKAMEDGGITGIKLDAAEQPV